MRDTAGFQDTRHAARIELDPFGSPVLSLPLAAPPLLSRSSAYTPLGRATRGRGPLFFLLIDLHPFGANSDRSQTSPFAYYCYAVLQTCFKPGLDSLVPRHKLSH